MEKDVIQFKRLTNENDIMHSLFSFLDVFPGLKLRIDSLENYIKKLSTNAIVIEGRLENESIAFAAIYNNDKYSLTGYIALIGVKKEFRGKAYGMKLLNYCLEQMKHSGMKQVKLEVDDDNTCAIRFYQQNGFTISEKDRKSVV